MRRLVVVAMVLVVALGGALAIRLTRDGEEPLLVVHWSNSHLTREGLLPAMADDFNDGDHETSSGQPIEVVVVPCDSAVQADDLVARATGGRQTDAACKGEDGGPAGAPTIVTPQSRDWLVDVNHRAQRTVVDLGTTRDIVRTWMGIVTYREMAQCLGWPAKELGYSDILQLKATGWEAHADCADTAWGDPRLAFTNPRTSTSGRNVLVSLYAMANPGKAVEQLTVADIERPSVVDFVKRFQGLVDHYQPGTIPLNTKIVQGPRFGQFFLMPEDNLASLYLGKEKAIGLDGMVQPVPAVDPGSLVMVYPKEGAVLNAHAAGVVAAPWVTAEHQAAAADWIDFLQDRDRQSRFVAAGFRPPSGSDVAVDPEAFAGWGLDPAEPEQRIEPGDLAPDVLQRIIGSWGAVKNPAIVTFVVDTSGSMSGKPMEEVKRGLLQVVDAMSGADLAGAGNQVGLVTFSTAVNAQLPPRPLEESKFAVARAVEEMQPGGATALYDAVRRGIELTDATPGDPRTTRAVVVLSDGAATAGGCLHELLEMQQTARERPVRRFCPPPEGVEDAEVVEGEDGTALTPADVSGLRLRLPLAHEVQVFFLGFGEADADIGRILAEATGAEYQGSTEEDLASVIEELSGYF
jgi:Ca-activated chloride channel homolog